MAAARVTAQNAVVLQAPRQREHSHDVLLLPAWTHDFIGPAGDAEIRAILDQHTRCGDASFNLEEALAAKAQQFTVFHDELARQTAFHCPRLAEMLVRTWASLCRLTQASLSASTSSRDTCRALQQSLQECVHTLAPQLQAVRKERDELRSQLKALQAQHDALLVKNTALQRQQSAASDNASLAQARLSAFHMVIAGGTSSGVVFRDADEEARVAAVMSDMRVRGAVELAHAANVDSGMGGPRSSQFMAHAVIEELQRAREEQAQQTRITAQLDALLMSVSNFMEFSSTTGTASSDKLGRFLVHSAGAPPMHGPAHQQHLGKHEATQEPVDEASRTERDDVDSHAISAYSDVDEDEFISRARANREHDVTVRENGENATSSAHPIHDDGDRQRPRTAVVLRDAESQGSPRHGLRVPRSQEQAHMSTVSLPHSSRSTGLVLSSRRLGISMATQTDVSYPPSHVQRLHHEMRVDSDIDATNCLLGPPMPAIPPRRMPNLPFDMRTLMSVFTFPTALQPMLPSLLRRMLMQILLEKSSYDRYTLSSYGCRVSLGHALVDSWSTRYGLPHLADRRLCELVLSMRAHAAEDPWVRFVDLLLGAVSRRDDGRAHAPQWLCDFVVSILDDMRRARSRQQAACRPDTPQSVASTEAENMMTVPRALAKLVLRSRLRMCSPLIVSRALRKLARVDASTATMRKGDDHISALSLLQIASIAFTQEMLLWQERIGMAFDAHCTAGPAFTTTVQARATLSAISNPHATCASLTSDSCVHVAPACLPSLAAVHLLQHAQHSHRASQSHAATKASSLVGDDGGASQVLRKRSLSVDATVAEGVLPAPPRSSPPMMEAKPAVCDAKGDASRAVGLCFAVERPGVRLSIADLLQPTPSIEQSAQVSHALDLSIRHQRDVTRGLHLQQEHTVVSRPDSDCTSNLTITKSPMRTPSADIVAPLVRVPSAFDLNKADVKKTPAAEAAVAAAVMPAQSATGMKELRSNLRRRSTSGATLIRKRRTAIVAVTAAVRLSRSRSVSDAPRARDPVSATTLPPAADVERDDVVLQISATEQLGSDPAAIARSDAGVPPSNKDLPLQDLPLQLRSISCMDTFLHGTPRVPLRVCLAPADAAFADVDAVYDDAATQEPTAPSHEIFSPILPSELCWRTLRKIKTVCMSARSGDGDANGPFFTVSCPPGQAEPTSFGMQVQGSLSLPPRASSSSGGRPRRAGSSGGPDSVVAASNIDTSMLVPYNDHSSVSVKQADDRQYLQLAPGVDELTFNMAERACDVSSRARRSMYHMTKEGFVTAVQAVDTWAPLTKLEGVFEHARARLEDALWHVSCAGWHRMTHAPSGRKYWCNTRTHETSWLHPPASALRRVNVSCLDFTSFQEACLRHMLLRAGARVTRTDSEEITAECARCIQRAWRFHQRHARSARAQPSGASTLITAPSDLDHVVQTLDVACHLQREVDNHGNAVRRSSHGVIIDVNDDAGSRVCASAGSVTRARSRRASGMLSPISTPIRTWRGTGGIQSSQPDLSESGLDIHGLRSGHDGIAALRPFTHTTVLRATIGDDGKELQVQSLAMSRPLTDVPRRAVRMSGAYTTGSLSLTPARVAVAPGRPMRGHAGLGSRSGMHTPDVMLLSLQGDAVTGLGSPSTPTAAWLPPQPQLHPHSTSSVSAHSDVYMSGSWSAEEALGSPPQPGAVSSS